MQCFQVRRRSTFMRLGHSALMRKALEKEQKIQNEMIQSLMPQKVAQEVMQGSYDSEDEDVQEEATDVIVASGNENVNDVQMNSLSTNKKVEKKGSVEKKSSKSRDSISFSDDTDDSVDENEPLRGVEAGTCKRKFI